MTSARVSAEEARAIAQRFVDGHFGNEGREGPRISIPANPERDDDLRLASFIAHAELQRAVIRGVEAALGTACTGNLAADVARVVRAHDTMSDYAAEMRAGRSDAEATLRETQHALTRVQGDANVALIAKAEARDALRSLLAGLSMDDKPRRDAIDAARATAATWDAPDASIAARIEAAPPVEAVAVSHGRYGCTAALIPWIEVDGCGVWLIGERCLRCEHTRRSDLPRIATEAEVLAGTPPVEVSDDEHARDVATLAEMRGRAPEPKVGDRVRFRSGGMTLTGEVASAVPGMPCTVQVDGVDGQHWCDVKEVTVLPPVEAALVEAPHAVGDVDTAPHRVGDVWRWDGNARTDMAVTLVTPPDPSRGWFEPQISFDGRTASHVGWWHGQGYERIRCAPVVAAPAVGERVRFDDNGVTREGVVGRVPTAGSRELYRVDGEGSATWMREAAALTVVTVAGEGE